MLRLENITFSYDEETEALKDVTLNIEKGKKTLFLGENGSGKSTLFLIMNGLLKAQKGNVYFEGGKIKHKKKDLEELRRKVGIIFQDPEIQIFAPLVFQEVAYGPENLGYSPEKVEEKVNRAMKEINIEDLKDRPCHHLSYGQKKRVSIAAITAMEPELLILDEPTAWLDSKNTKRVSEILDNFSKAGKTMVVSTHDTDFAYEFADYIYVLDKGKIVRQGNRDEIFEDFSKLLNKEEIFETINDSMTFGNLEADFEKNIWNLFFHSGYLTLAKEYDEINEEVYLKIPNEEILKMFSKMFIEVYF